MRADVGIVAVAYERGAIAGLGLVELAALEINVAEREVMMRLFEGMDLILEVLYAPPGGGAGQMEAARGRRAVAIDHEEIQERADEGSDPDKHGPDVFAPAYRIDEHPDLERDGGHAHDQRRHAVPVAQQTANETRHGAGV